MDTYELRDGLQDVKYEEHLPVFVVVQNPNGAFVKVPLDKVNVHADEVELFGESKGRSYSNGRIEAEDEGDLNIMMGETQDGKALIMDFGKRTGWIGFSKEDARVVAERLLAFANKEH